MDVSPIGPQMTLLSSNQDLQKDINALEAQMQGLDPNSPEYLYDQLNLELEKNKQKIREENPNLNPLNPADAKKLDQLVGEDPTVQSIKQQIHELTSLFPSESTKWGIPWDFTSAVPVQ